MLKDYLPEEGLYMLRYHSFYAWHREGGYDHLLDDHDRKMLKWVQLFNPYDLYSKIPNHLIGTNSGPIMKILYRNICHQL
ncbi:inositol oxygenase [Niabella sp. W65]|nr:inositol oxygenase [Niabella sp. W65]MCH7363473.1 inositol oxygenase [Niabella sp. W65]